MRLKIATIFALIGSILVIGGCVLSLYMAINQFETSDIDTLIMLNKIISILNILGWVTIINFFISFIIAQRKRG